jgi:hypothetical protein
VFAKARANFADHALNIFLNFKIMTRYREMSIFLRSNALHAAAISLLSVFASQAQALVSADVGYGRRTSKVSYDYSGVSKDASLTGTEMFASVQVNPFVALPVAFGVTAQSISTDTGAVSKDMMQGIIDSQSSQDFVSVSGSGKATALLYGPTIKIWAPIPYIKPYLKLSFLTGTELLDQTSGYSTLENVTPVTTYTQTSKISYTKTGRDLQLGLDFAPMKLISFFFEYSIHRGTSAAKSLDYKSTTVVSGVTTSDSADSSSLTDANKTAKRSDAKSVRFGLSVGI